MNPLFETYNKSLERYYQGIRFFEKNPDKIDENLGRCVKLIRELGAMVDEINNSGYYMSPDEILNGFRQIKYLEV